MFLAEMEAVLPCPALIEPHHPKTCKKDGRASVLTGSYAADPSVSAVVFAPKQLCEYSVMALG
jgi:hypothetical protein